MRKLIAVAGGHSANTIPEAMSIAEAVGEALGRSGYGILTGGGDGIMEAACRGCRRGGGLTVGILKGTEPGEANGEVDVAIPTSLDVASNNIMVWAGLGLIAFPGRYGTLNEIALALDFGKPVILVGPPGLLNVDAIAAPYFRHLPLATDPRAVVAALEELLATAPVMEPRRFLDRTGAWSRAASAAAEEIR